MSTNTDALQEIDSLSDTDPDLEQKLQKIAELVAAARKESRSQDPDAPVDPSDEFACEGCQ